ncbi:MAG: class I SAM-dependent methyltransferase [Candidatus Caenarcaniphilales bacterium]|nr:class I SAM-dependent methyltransferase [Candidatus Caenarcaniphilales bacterium]
MNKKIGGPNFSGDGFGKVPKKKKIKKNIFTELKPSSREDKTTQAKPVPSPNVKALVKEIGLQERDIAKYYGPRFLEIVNETGDSGKSKMSFWNNSTTFGWPSSLQATSNGIGAVDIKSSQDIFVDDLQLAASDRISQLPEGETLNVLDLGSGAGLSTLSTATVVDNLFSQLGKDPNYSITGADIVPSFIEKAQAGEYSVYDIVDGYHELDEAKQIDDSAMEQASKNPKYKKFISQQNSRKESLNSMLAQRFLEPTEDNTLKLKPEFLANDSKTKIQYQQVKPFNLKGLEGNYDIVTSFKMFGAMVDEGKAKMLDEIASKMKKNSYLVSDLFMGETVPGKSNKTPRLNRIVQKHFDIVPVQKPGEQAYVSNALLKKK